MASARKKSPASRSQFTSRLGIDVITWEVKNFEFKKAKHWMQAKTISERINAEWVGLSNWYEKKMNYKKFNPSLAAEYEAQQQIIFCLINLLNEKLLDFLKNTQK